MKGKFNYFVGSGESSSLNRKEYIILFACMCSYQLKFSSIDVLLHHIVFNLINLSISHRLSPCYSDGIRVIRMFFRVKNGRGAGISEMHNGVGKETEMTMLWLPDTTL